MITTRQIRSALTAALVATGEVEAVMALPVADLSAALEHLRDSPESLAVIVPSQDSWSHQMADEDGNLPAHAEQRNEFEILVTARDLARGQDGAAEAVDLKDALTAALLWADLGIPGLLCLPLTAEPMVIEITERRGREAWKITLETRTQLTP